MPFLISRLQHFLLKVVGNLFHREESYHCRPLIYLFYGQGPADAGPHPGGGGLREGGAGGRDEPATARGGGHRGRQDAEGGPH